MKKNKSNSPIIKYLISGLVVFSVAFLLRSIKRNSLCTYLELPDYDQFYSFLLINLFISVAIMVPVALFFERQKIASFFKQPTSQAPVQNSSPTQTWRGFQKSKVAWGIFAAACILGVILVANHKSSGSGGSHSSYSSSSHKSARQLITDYAKDHYGHNADVEIEGGFAGGSYQVTVRTRVEGGTYDGGINHSSYTVTVDESAQKITSWQMYDHN